MVDRYVTGILASLVSINLDGAVGVGATPAAKTENADLAFNLMICEKICREYYLGFRQTCGVEQNRGSVNYRTIFSSLTGAFAGFKINDEQRLHAGAGFRIRGMRGNPVGLNLSAQHLFRIMKGSSEFPEGQHVLWLKSGLEAGYFLEGDLQAMATIGVSWNAF